MTRSLPDYPPALVEVPRTSTIFVTITSGPPSATSTPTHSSSSSSDVKAVIAGSVVGGFLGCCLVFSLVFWLCWRRPNKRRPDQGEIAPVRSADEKGKSGLLFGLSCLGSPSTEPAVRGRGSRLSRTKPTSSRPVIGRPSAAASTDGETVPKNIPMVHPRNPYPKTPPTSSGRNRASSLWRRGSTDEAKDVKPPPYQYGVVGSRRPSVSTQPPSPGHLSSGSQAYGEPGLRLDPADDGFGGPTAVFSQYLNQDTPSLPTSPSMSYSPSNVAQASLSSMQPRIQGRVSIRQFPSEFGYGPMSGSAYSASGSRHSNSPLLNMPSTEFRDRDSSLTAPLPSRSRISYPRPSDHRYTYSAHRDGQSRSDEGHGPPTSSHVYTSSRGALQRSQSMQNGAGGHPVSHNHHLRRAYDHRPRSSGPIMPPPSAFSFSSLRPADVTSSSDGSDDKDDPQVHQNRGAVGPAPAPRRSSFPPVLRADSRRPTGEVRPPSPPDLLSDEIAVLAHNARRAERRLTRSSEDDWERDRRDSDEGPKILVLRNG